MEVTLLLIVIGELENISKGLVNEQEDLEIGGQAVTM